MRTVDYINFFAQITEKLRNDGLYNEKWLIGQRSRISMMWDAGETVDSAYETIRAFASAQLGDTSVKSLNPTAAPICVGVKYI